MTTEPDPTGTPDDPETEEEPPEQTAAEQLAAAQAESKKWRDMARKHERQAKANADKAEKLQQLELAGKSDEEKHRLELEEARTAARTATIAALKLQVAAEKSLPAGLAKFLPDVDDEIDMMTAADELLEAAGQGAKPPPSQPKSNLTNPLSDGDPDTQRQAVLNAMLGRPT